MNKRSTKSTRKKAQNTPIRSQPRANLLRRLRKQKKAQRSPN
jgi:hypothetical protein